VRIQIPKYRRPIAPGEVLLEDYIEPLGMTQGQFAEAIGVNRTTVNEILNGRRSITPEMAVRLGHVLGTSVEYWLGLQLGVDTYDALHAPIKAEVKNLPVLGRRQRAKVVQSRASSGKRR
jgi:addiction module HigA family antidote